jgi:hypothetical protein
MTNLPEPAAHLADALPVFTEAQMLQFRRDTLEEAYKLCRQMEIAIDGGGNAYYRPADARQCAQAILKLKETNVLTF